MGNFRHVLKLTGRLRILPHTRFGPSVSGTLRRIQARYSSGLRPVLFLKKLEKEGCIYLEKDVGNRKNKTIHFTEKGNELVRNTVDHVFEVERRAFEKLSEEEKKGVLYYGLRHVNVLADETEKFLTEEKNLTE